MVLYIACGLCLIGLGILAWGYASLQKSTSFREFFQSRADKKMIFGVCIAVAGLLIMPH
ncbi:MAG: hypothetical protein WCV85_00700 [Patescibacteria group bacterium]|jgi:hypothetical protein